MQIKSIQPPPPHSYFIPQKINIKHNTKPIFIFSLITKMNYSIFKYAGNMSIYSKISFSAVISI